MPLKQNCSHLNSSSYPCKKKKNNNYYCQPVRTAGATCLKQNFSQVPIPKQFCCQPSHLPCYLSGHIMNFVYCSIIAILPFIISIDSINMFYSTLTVNFLNSKFPQNNVLTFHRHMYISNDTRSKDVISPGRIHTVAYSKPAGFSSL